MGDGDERDDQRDDGDDNGGRELCDPLHLDAEAANSNNDGT